MAALLKWMVFTFVRFVGLAVTILGVWTAVLNLVEGVYPGAALAIITAFGTIGVAGGLAYLLSFDGPARFRERWVRVVGWAGMLISVLLPSSLTVMLVPLVLVVSPTLFLTPDRGAGTEEPVTSE